MIEIPFLPHKHDYILVHGLVYRNSKQAMLRFLVDTGASMTMIAPAVMQSIGYTPECTEYVSSATVSSPIGKEEGYRVKAQRVLIHSAECVLPNIDIACIRPERNIDALLGLNFLRHFRYSVDHKRHLLTLEKN